MHASARRIGGRLLALGVSLLFALVVVEVALRLMPGRKHWMVMPPNISRVYHPPRDVFPGLSPETHLTINRMGLRGPLPGSDAAEYRIVAIGGSTTECLYTDDQRTWTAQVHRALPRLPDGRAAWLAAAGKSGAYSRDHVLHLTHLVDEVPRLEAALVLVGVNDLTVALSAGDDYRAPPPLSDPDALRAQIRRAFAVAPGRIHEPTTDFQMSADAAFYKRTALFQLARTLKGALMHSDLQQDDAGTTLVRWRDNRRGTPHPLRAHLPDLAAALAEYRSNLLALADVAERGHVRLLLLTQPSLWRPDLSPEEQKLLWLGGLGTFQEKPGAVYFTPGALADAMARFNAVTLEVCRERHLDCLDLAERIPRRTDNFYDDCHFTDQGSDLVAREVSAWLGGLLTKP